MNTKIAFLALTLSAVLPVLAQTPAAAPDAKNDNKCPVEFKAMMHGKDSPKGSYVSVSFTNTSDKTIANSKFGVIVYDPVGHHTDYEKILLDKHEVKPGKTDKLSEETTIEMKSGFHADDPQHRNGVQVFLFKLNFADGTSWTDDGSKKCASTIE